MPLIVLALVVAAAVGGGASVAAQNALPGEPLWVFKVQVNERVGATLAPGDKAKAGWDIALVRERMEEAEIVAAEGALSTSAQAASKANINAHIQGLSQRVASLQERGDYAASILFTTTRDKQNGKLEVFSRSPRDGSVENLVSVSIVLVPN